jgi:L-ascorbate metabolism protein UlaG (beta-lactamase superfamily)
MKFRFHRRQIVELDWWESKKCDEMEFICTPAQHFSGRTLFDRDKTLWSS